MKKYSLTLIIILICCVFLSGCTTDNNKYCTEHFPGTTYDPSSKMCEHTTTPTPTQTPMAISSPVNTITTTSVSQSPSPPITTKTISPSFKNGALFQLGQTATDGNLKVTVSNERFVESFTVTGNEQTGHYNQMAKPGWQFMVVDVTIENIQQNSNISVGQSQYNLLHKDPIHYHFCNTDRYPNGIGTVRLAPGQKKSGEVACEYEKNSEDLKFEFIFEFENERSNLSTRYVLFQI